MRSRSLFESFNYAIRGIMWAYKHERNFKIHILMSLLVMILGVVLNISKIEFITALMCIGMVLSGELINTAIEKVCDGITGEFKIYIKAAKDIAAGAVLVMSMISAMVGIIIFGNALMKFEGVSLERLFTNKTYIALLVIIVTLTVVFILKMFFGRGTPMHGGMPSGHSALSFAIATVISIYSGNLMIMGLSYILALIVAESRVESKIHSITEVALGAVLGIIVAIVIMGGIYFLK